MKNLLTDFMMPRVLLAKKCENRKRTTAVNALNEW